MTPSDWRELLRTLRGLGLEIVSLDTASGRVTVQVPPVKENR